MQKTKNRKFISKKGKPSGIGHEKASLKDVNVEHLEEELNIEDKYTSETDEAINTIAKRHPNRNLNKPDIDKPAYS